MTVAKAIQSAVELNMTLKWPLGTLVIELAVTDVIYKIAASLVCPPSEDN